MLYKLRKVKCRSWLFFRKQNLYLNFGLLFGGAFFTIEFKLFSSVKSKLSQIFESQNFVLFTFAKHSKFEVAVLFLVYHVSTCHFFSTINKCVLFFSRLQLHLLYYIGNRCFITYLTYATPNL